MSNTSDFIHKYYALYLIECRVPDLFIEEMFNETQLFFPPTADELETLLLYLQEKELSPLITGTLGVMKYANVTKEDIRANKYRPTDKLELFLAGKPPPPPEGWKVKVNSAGQTFWISSTNGVVKFLGKKELPDPSFPVKADPESLKAGCPVADPATLFMTKISSPSPIDLGDLLHLGAFVGVPRGLTKYLKEPKQKNSLKFIRKWIKLRGKRSLP